MAKVLVAYFSVSGVTEKVAKESAIPHSVSKNLPVQMLTKESGSGERFQRRI